MFAHYVIIKLIFDSYVLLHHIMGEWNGVQDTWCFVKGGMGSVSNAIARSASDKGAHLFVSQVSK